LFSALFLTLAATSDSFLVGFHYGMKGVRVGRAANLFISAVCFIGTLLAMRLGRALGLWWQDVSNWLGGGVLLAFGIYMLVLAFRECGEDSACPMEDPKSVDKDHSKVIELRESFFIGAMLSLNNMGLGIGAGLAGIPILFMSLMCALGSFLFVSCGCRIGSRVKCAKNIKLIELLAALFVMALGMWELVKDLIV